MNAADSTARAYDDKPAGYFGNVRREIEPWLPVHAARVLEVGCGSGATLAWLKSCGRAGAAVGIEPFEAAAAQARTRIDELHMAPAEAALGDLADASFDLVLCLDVLEHLVDPWHFVSRLPRVMKHGALLIASVPNVRHAGVVLPLLVAGRWRYGDHGLLDRTHLRFFTRDSAVELLSVPGLVIERCERRLHGWPSRTAWLNALTLGLLTDFLAINFLIVARRV